ncbi:DUF1427 family protein [Streptomyces sp. NPDC087859]|uniref:DUF1427 family protein n=1 Tax=Streptomyces sp. NPDC087859 TaxID=3365812 RepID=UPI0037FB4035
MSATASQQIAASVLVGFLAGGLYVLLGAPSPAPPWPALVGLLGILLGEHATRAVVTRTRPLHRDDPQE